jgi:hypothetical protein
MRLKQTVLKTIVGGHLAATLAALAVAQTPRYTVTDLGTLGGAGTNSTAFEMKQCRLGGRILEPD